MLDLTKGNPFKILIRYMLPLFGSIVFQQIYNIADSIIAGKFLGEGALAAVGNSYEITLIYLSFAFGCNMGASVVSARLFGAKKYDDMKTAISTSYIAAIVTCGVLMIIGFALSSSLLQLLNTPAEILEDSLTYINIYTGGLIFLFLYNLTTGVFAALGDSRTPFVFLVVSSLANIGMDVLFVAEFDMGVAGVAWATFICQGASCVAALIALVLALRKVKSERKLKFFSVSALKEFMLIGVPSALQQCCVSFGNIAIQGLINSFGTSTIAGYSAAIKFNNFAVVSIVTVSNGMSNYTAQNLGADKVYRIKDGVKAALLLALGIAAIFFVVYMSASSEIMLLFLNPENTEAINVGHTFMWIVSPFYFVCALKIVPDGVLKGGEKMWQFMIATMVDLVVRVGLSFAFAPTFGSMGIWMSWPFGWFLGAVCSQVFFFTNKWKLSARSAHDEEYAREQA